MSQLLQEDCDRTDCWKVASSVTSLYFQRNASLCAMDGALIGNFQVLWGG